MPRHAVSVVVVSIVKGYTGALSGMVIWVKQNCVGRGMLGSPTKTMKQEEGVRQGKEGQQGGCVKRPEYKGNEASRQRQPIGNGNKTRGKITNVYNTKWAHTGNAYGETRNRYNQPQRQ